MANSGFWGVRAAVALLEGGSPALLARGHAAAAAQLGVGEPVEEMGAAAGHQVVPGGVELAVLERLEAVEGEGLGERAFGAMLLVEQQAVAAEPVGMEQHGLGGGVEGPGDLAQAGARDQAAQHGGEQPGSFEPVGGAEGLLAEATPAVTAAVTLDPEGRRLAVVEAIADDPPTDGRGMKWAARIGAEGGPLRGRRAHRPQPVASAGPSPIFRAQLKP
jgi:hypothetical protein